MCSIRAISVRFSPSERSISARPTAKATSAAPRPAVDEGRRAEALARAEAELAMAEAELKLLEREMNDPLLQSDPEKSAAIAADYAAKAAEVEQRYERWGALAEEE